MTAPNIFPLHYYCYDRYGWADCPALAKRIWMRIRLAVAPDLIWYGVAMRVDSAHSLTLLVYEMECNLSGGIGKQVFACSVTRDTLTPDECAMLDAELINAMTAHAERELDAREQRARQERIAAVRKELFNV